MTYVPPCDHPSCTQPAITRTDIYVVTVNPDGDMDGYPSKGWACALHTTPFEVMRHV